MEKIEEKLDYSKIIIDPSKLVKGKRYYAADSIVRLGRLFEEGATSIFDRVKPLCSDKNMEIAFAENGMWYSLWYPAPEPTYAERQAEWVRQNNVRFGTKVRFTKNFTSGEDGSGCCENKCVKGMEGVVKYAEDDYLYVLVPYFGCLKVPFTALEVIKEPTYRPYNNDELNDLVGEVLTNKKSGRRKLVTGKPTASDFVTLDGNYITAEGLLSSFYRNTNEPCGMKE